MKIAHIYKLFQTIFILCLVIILIGCKNNHIQSNHYNTVTTQQQNDSLTNFDKFQPTIEEQKPIKHIPKKFKQKVSLYINEKMSIKELLLSFASKNDINIVIDDNVASVKGISYSAENKEIHEILEDLSCILNIRYYIKNDTIYVSKDTPYFHTYSLSFIFSTRSSKTDSAISTDMGSNTDGSSISNESKSSIESVTEIDFWQELEQNILFILKGGIEKSVKSPKKKKKKKKESSITWIKEKYKYNDNPVLTQALKDVEEHTKTLAEDSDYEDHESEQPNDSFEKCIIHKQAGLVSVYATEKQHKKIKSYIKQLKSMIFTQVIIEAKIIELEVDDKYELGIDWNLLSSSKIPIKGSMPFSIMSQQEDLGTQGNIISIGSDDTNLIIKALQIFGKIHIMSNTLIRVLNNQPVLMKVVQNYPWFKTMKSFTTIHKNASEVVTGSDVKVIRVGVIFTLQAVADIKNNEIIISINVVISRIKGFVEDPSVTLEANKSGNKTTSKVPIVQHQEVNSLIKVRNGDSIVIGGLVESNISKRSSGLPGISKHKILSTIFGNKTEKCSKKQIVIVMTAKIDKSENNINTTTQKKFNFFDNSTSEDNIEKSDNIQKNQT